MPAAVYCCLTKHTVSSCSEEVGVGAGAVRWLTSGRVADGQQVCTNGVRRWRVGLHLRQQRIHQHAAAFAPVLHVAICLCAHRWGSRRRIQWSELAAGLSLQ
jgi:hypothetical protein